MADSNTFPSDKEDEREQRLIRDLRHMYHTEVEIAQALSRVKVEQGGAGFRCVTQLQRSRLCLSAPFRPIAPQELTARVT